MSFALILFSFLGLNELPIHNTTQPEIANFSTKYLILSKVYTYERYITVCPPVREIIHSLKLVDYLLVHADCYVADSAHIMRIVCYFLSGCRPRIRSKALPITVNGTIVNGCRLTRNCRRLSLSTATFVRIVT